MAGAIEEQNALIGRVEKKVIIINLTKFLCSELICFLLKTESNTLRVDGAVKRTAKLLKA
jgi:hypothetical protein